MIQETSANELTNEQDQKVAFGIISTVVQTYGKVQNQICFNQIDSKSKLGYFTIKFEGDGFTSISIHKLYSIFANYKDKLHGAFATFPDYVFSQKGINLYFEVFYHDSLYYQYSKEKKIAKQRKSNAKFINYTTSVEIGENPQDMVENLILGSFVNPPSVEVMVSRPDDNRYDVTMSPFANFDILTFWFSMSKDINSVVNAMLITDDSNRSAVISFTKAEVSKKRRENPNHQEEEEPKKKKKWWSRFNPFSI